MSSYVTLMSPTEAQSLALYGPAPIDLRPLDIPHKGYYNSVGVTNRWELTVHLLLNRFLKGINNPKYSGIIPRLIYSDMQSMATAMNNHKEYLKAIQTLYYGPKQRQQLDLVKLRRTLFVLLTKPDQKVEQE